MLTPTFYAVITGDLIRSSEINRDYHLVLHAIAEDIKKHYDENFIFEIYRGDSFQAMLRNPADALKLGVIIRAGLRRYSRSSSVNDAWDARIGIGIGRVDFEDYTRLGEMTGEGFTRSGQSLDDIMNTESRLRILTGDEQTDREFMASCALADTIISRWTTGQAAAIYIELVKNKTQAEIGEELNVSQRAISKRLETADLDSLILFFNRYKELIEWKFSS